MNLFKCDPDRERGNKVENEIKFLLTGKSKTLLHILSQRGRGWVRKSEGGRKSEDD